MDWILLTFLSVLSRAIYGVMTKVMSNGIKISVYGQTFLLMIVCGLLAIVAAPFAGGFGGGFSDVNLTALFLLVVGSALGNILYFSAIKHLTSGTAQITFSSILIFNTVLAVIFSQLSLSWINIIGLFLLMIAVLSVTSGKIELNSKGVVLMLVSAFCFAVLQLSSAAVSKQISVSSYLLVSYFGPALLIFFIKSKQIVRDIKSIKGTSVYKTILFTALPSLGYFAFAYFAYRAAPEPAKVAILLTSQVVIAVLLSYFFLKEKQNVAIKIIAGILVIISAFLLKS